MIRTLHRHRNSFGYRLFVATVVLCALAWSLSVNCQMPKARKVVMADCAELMSVGGDHANHLQPAKADCTDDQPCYQAWSVAEIQWSLSVPHAPPVWSAIVAFLFIALLAPTAFLFPQPSGPPLGRRIALFTLYCSLRD